MKRRGIIHHKDEDKEIEEKREMRKERNKDATNGTILFYESINIWFIIYCSIINIIINNLLTNDLKIIRIKIIHL